MVKSYPEIRAPRRPLVERECQACGKAFMAKPSNVAVGGAKACSKECSYKVRKTRSDKQPRKSYECKRCGKEFVEDRPRGTQKYCSQDCAIEATATRPISIVQCETCGETIVTRDSNRRFCCMACKRVDDSKRMLGEVGERLRARCPMHIRHREQMAKKQQPN